MDRQPVEPGFEFVLDNRKLIVIFAVLIAVCAGFFVFGFVEGKRQALKPEIQKTPVVPSNPETAAAPAEDNKVPSNPAPAVSDPAIRDQLEWYKNVKDRRESAAKRKESPARAKAAKKVEPPSPTGAATPETRVAPPTTESSPGVSPAGKPTYSVQVAAYRNRRDAEARAEALKSKGYEFLIEPSSTKELYHLKVGKFDSRDEAAAMEKKLRHDGFSTLIKKTNP
jgi:cell division protein FtsN